MRSINRAVREVVAGVAALTAVGATNVERNASAQRPGVVEGKKPRSERDRQRAIDVARLRIIDRDIARGVASREENAEGETLRRPRTAQPRQLTAEKERLIRYDYDIKHGFASREDELAARETGEDYKRDKGKQE